MSIAINGVISSLVKDERLRSIHTVIRSQYSLAPDKVTFETITQDVTAVLQDFDSFKKSKPVREEEDPVASLTSCNFAKTKKRFPPKSNLKPNQPPRSPITKEKQFPTTPRRFHIDTKSYRSLSEKDQRTCGKMNKVLPEYLKLKKLFVESNGTMKQANRSKVEVEADLAEGQDPLSCLMAGLEDEILNSTTEQATEDEAESMDEESEEPKALFTSTATAPAESTTAKEKAIPKIESSPTGSMPSDSGPEVNEPASLRKLWAQIISVVFTATALFWQGIEYVISSLC